MTFEFKELDVIKELRINENDVVTVALAKIEQTIRKKVRDSKAQAGSLRKEIQRMEKEIPKIGESVPPPGMILKMKALNTALKKYKLGKEAKWMVAYDYNLNMQENTYKFQLAALDLRGDPRRTITIKLQTNSFSKAQKDYVKKIDQYVDQEANLINDGIAAKASLNDMAAAERSMRALVVENELKKTKQGAALVKLLTDNYEGIVKKLAM